MNGLPNCSPLGKAIILLKPKGYRAMGSIHEPDCETNKTNMRLPSCLSRIMAAMVVAAGVAAVPSRVLAQVAPIQVFNTGVDASGNALPGYSTDPHWTQNVTYSDPSIPYSINPGPATVLTGGAFYGGWTPDSSTSAWIGVVNDNNPYYGSWQPPAPYSFTETFSLAGLDPLTAQLSGTWFADDFVGFYLNGNLIGLGGPDINNGQWNGAAFSVTDTGADAGWFLPGQNIRLLRC